MRLLVFLSFVATSSIIVKKLRAGFPLLFCFVFAFVFVFVFFGADLFFIPFFSIPLEKISHPLSNIFRLNSAHARLIPYTEDNPSWDSRKKT